MVMAYSLCLWNIMFSQLRPRPGNNGDAIPQLPLMADIDTKLLLVDCIFGGYVNAGVIFPGKVQELG